MRRSIYLLPVLALLVFAGSAQALMLTTAGKTNYAIVIANDAIPAERTAAAELQSYLRQVTSAEFPVCLEHEVAAGAPQILVGQSKRAKALAPGVDWAKLESDTVVIKTVGSDLILAGGRPRGSLYAVYTFLEDTVGCRWWTSTESTIPRKTTLTIPGLDVNYTPKLRYREAYYRDTNENALFSVKLKLNGHFYDIPREYGSHYSIIGWCHTIYDMLPPSKYFAQHPDWYSEVNGKRIADGAQLCFSNEEMRKELTRVALERIRKEPDAGIISISQNDWVNPCDCAKCKAIEAEEGGARSAPIIKCINAVAEEIEKEFPNVLVETLAYQYSRKPPRNVRPRRNVVVRLCTIENNFSKPFDSDENKGFRDDIRQWASLAPNLYIWDYVTNFGDFITPQPNMRILAPNLRLFVKNNAIGVFEQGDADCSVGDFVRYRAWLLAHLMWNPDLDEQKLIQEFLDGYYGAAGPYIRAYFDAIHDAPGLKTRGIACIYDDTGWLSFSDVAKATECFDKAERAVAKDSVLLARVQRDRMPLDLVWLLHYNDFKSKAAADHVPFPGPKDPNSAAGRFLQMGLDWNARNQGNGVTFESYAKQFTSWYPAPQRKAK